MSQFDHVTAYNTASVEASTFGHLAPKAGINYNGEIVFCVTEFGQTSVISFDFENLSSSPWFYTILHDYIFELEHKELGKPESGVYKFTGYFRQFLNLNYVFNGVVEEISTDKPEYISKGKIYTKKKFGG